MKLVKGIYLPDSDTHFETIMDDDGNYQKPQFDAALKYIPEENRGLFIDVGAHVGLWSIMAMKNGFKNFLCFEPDDENFKCLWENFEDNRVLLGGAALNVKGREKEEITEEKRITGFLYNWALSDEMKMYHIKNEKEDNSGAKILEEVEFSEEATQRFDELVELNNRYWDLDKFKNKILIKIDVQGYEAKVVRGMKNFIQEYKPIIIVEQFINKQPDYEATMILKSYGMKPLEAVGKEVILGW